MAEVEICAVCGGRLKSRQELALLLRQMQGEAKAAIAEHEPTDDPVERLQAELDFVDVAIRQVASELTGLCSDCWDGE